MQGLQKGLQHPHHLLPPTFLPLPQHVCRFRRIANIYFLGISILMLLGTYLPKLFESPL